jgi:hypothetical protein
MLVSLTGARKLVVAAFFDIVEDIASECGLT